MKIYIHTLSGRTKTESIALFEPTKITLERLPLFKSLRASVSIFNAPTFFRVLSYAQKYGLALFVQNPFFRISEKSWLLVHFKFA